MLLNALCVRGYPVVSSSFANVATQVGGILHFPFKLLQYFISACHCYITPQCPLPLIHSRKLFGSNAASERNEKQTSRRRIPRTLGHPGVLVSIGAAISGWTVFCMAGGGRGGKGGGERLCMDRDLRDGSGGGTSILIHFSTKCYTWSLIA
ncbi:hypothetical protein PUN28_016379 [Cardiocondyla obscurior]|uniref:Uncharacterized protein n=1 Tax=Cardiocondyla obscurior TaxID=286306 RepID=A0AAW2ESA4_9HYME